MSVLPNVEAAEVITMETSTMDFFSSTVPNYMDTVECENCCETRQHGYVIVNAEVIQDDCPSSSTFMPISSTVSTTDFSSTLSFGTSELPTSSLRPPSTTTTFVTVTPSSTNSPTISSISTLNSSLSTSSTRSSTKPSSTSSSTPRNTRPSSSPIRSSSKLSTILSSSIISSSQPSSHSTSYPSSMFPSSAGPSSTLPDFSCGVGEICCETRTIGHVIVLAEVIGNQDGLTSIPPYSSTTSSS
ncbi:putative protein TPRXL [Mercenaria mercenaria]|uniref:putative protein TPRXL n=1 Tax=Mercenaria mercenaria TaxID=6596 RepID=UPI00234E9ED9|nr:putative protein TPRXL [Mercenaria mercenaria]